MKMKSVRAGGVDGSSGAGSHDDGYLRHDAGRQYVVHKDVSVAAQARNTFLDSSTTGITQADNGAIVLQAHFHDLADLLGVGDSKTAAQHGEILGEGAGQTTVDLPVPDHHAVAGEPFLVHSEVHGRVVHELVHFLERAFIEQQSDPLACSELSLLVLVVDAALAASHIRFRNLVL